MELIPICFQSVTSAPFDMTNNSVMLNDAHAVQTLPLPFPSHEMKVNAPEPPNPEAAAFVWIRDVVDRRNQFVRFVRIFNLAVLPGELWLHLFADTRYRLTVNNAFLAAGPGRFVTQFPEFDSHDIARWLRVGGNIVSVEVNFYGASSFQTMPDGEPGFIVWGGGESVNLSTPGEWHAFRMDAWDSEAPPFSFAQGPVEICDTRRLESGTPVTVVELEKEEAPWGPLTAYSGPRIPYNILRPRHLELAGPLIDEEKRAGFMSKPPPQTPSGGKRHWVGFATWMLSPCEQLLTVSCFWSDLYCNGQPVEVSTDTPFGNHGCCILDLRAGWNFLTGRVEVLGEYWAYCLGIPRASGVSLHGRRDSACREPLAVSPVGDSDELELPVATDREAPAEWRLCDGDPRRLTPARMMAWDVPAISSHRKLAMEDLGQTARIRAAEATWCFSFEGEFLGHLVIEVEAPPDTIMDVACDDWQSTSGGVALYQSNPFTDAADRFVLRGGRQKVELFHIRGGKLVQVTLRTSGCPSDLILHDLFVRSRQTLVEGEAHLTSSMPALDWTWETSMRTLIVSTDESYSDCPWRERGNYIGDGHVNQHLNFLLCRDLRPARRSLRMFAQAQLPDGQLPCCAPAWLRKPHEDFTLIWLLTLRDYWAQTGDAAIVSELWPNVQRIWDSPTWKEHSSGLWNMLGTRHFMDWGCLETERTGEAHACINLFRMAAAKACAQMAAVIGCGDEADAFSKEADRIETTIINVLWDAKEGRLLPSLGAKTPALHANVLALAFGMGNHPLQMSILAYLEPRLLSNFARGLRHGQFSGHLELYFLYYLLPALAELERPDLAELLIAQHYGYLQSLGDDTLPECFCRVEQSVGSRCHSWSGAGAIYAARYVLGMRQAEPGNPDNLVFRPIVHSIDRATGRIAHRKGWIDVTWVKSGGKILHHIHPPQGVTLDFQGITERADEACCPPSRRREREYSAAPG